jgi:hypothetical protein
VRGIEPSDESTRLHVVMIDESGADVIKTDFARDSVVLGRVVAQTDDGLRVELPKLRVSFFHFGFCTVFCFYFLSSLS